MLVESKNIKLRIMVPVSAADAVRDALGKSGAGTQGNYAFCSGSHRQIGRFLPMSGADPAIGKIGEMTTVEEEVIETICPRDLLETVLKAVKKVHPYEEPAIDIIPLLKLQ